MSKDQVKLESVVSVNEKGEHIPKFHVTSWTTTLEFTNSESQAHKAYDKCSSRNKKLFKVDSEGLQTLIKSNYYY